jgi:hypothetical protein
MASPTEEMAERIRLSGGDVLIALAHAVATNEEVQRRFRTAVLVRLSRIETKLTDVQGAQLADFWAPGKVTDEQRARYIRQVEDRFVRSSEEMGSKMVKFVYGGTEALDEAINEETAVKRKTRRKWSGWEI